MSQPNTGKKKVPGPKSIKSHQPKKEYSLRSKHNFKTATISETSHSEERVHQTMNEERLLSYQNENPSVFAKPNDPNLAANDGYDHQADNHYGGNGYYHTDSQYDDHADYQYSGNGRNHRADDLNGGCRSDQTDIEGYGVSRRIRSNERHHFYGNYSYICRKYFWGNYQNNYDTWQPKERQFIGRGGMNFNRYCGYIPYDACFKGMYCIIPLLR